MKTINFTYYREYQIGVESDSETLALFGLSDGKIPENAFNEFYQQVVNNKNYNIRFGKNVYKAVSKLIKEPEVKPFDFDITQAPNFVYIRVHDKKNWYLVAYHNGVEVPGFNVRYFTEFCRVELPNSEIWRIPEIVANVRQKEYTVKISEEIQKEAEKQLALRSKLDKIAVLEDIEYPDVLKSIKLRPFQKVGASFVEAANGRAVICDEMGLGKSAQALAYVQKNNKRAVIICPASLKLNWERYLKDYLEESAYVCSGETPTGTDFKYLLVNKPRFVIINYDILGASMEGLDERNNSINVYPWAALITAAAYDCLIFDEYHKIKNVEAKRTKAALGMSADSVIGLSGTPILNRPAEAWPMLHILDKKQFPAYERFLSQYTYGGKSVKNVKELQSVLKPIMIRRVKKDVVKELPPINRVYEYTELKGEFKRRYDDVLNGIYETLSGAQYNVTNVLAQLMRLKQVCAQSKMEATAELAVELNDSMEGFKKVIVFSQFVDQVDYIHSVLGGSAVKFTGETSVPERMRMCDMFQNDDKIQFLVCTTQVAAEGLNLTQAGAVIFNDLMWTPAAHQQAEGRAYGRLNDSHSISAYYVIAKDSVEEYIMQLLANKLALIEQVIDGVNKVRSDDSVVSELISYIRGK